MWYFRQEAVCRVCDCCRQGVEEVLTELAV